MILHRPARLGALLLLAGCASRTGTFPEGAPALLEAADAAEASGRREEAVEALRRYTALRPRDAAAFRRLGDLELLLARWEAALQDYLAARALDPALPGVTEGIFRAADGLARREQERARTEVKPQIPGARGRAPS